MRLANLCCGLGSIVIGCGMYLVHPALACLWLGGVLVGLGVLAYLKEAKKVKPQ